MAQTSFQKKPSFHEEEICRLQLDANQHLTNPQPFDPVPIPHPLDSSNLNPDQLQLWQLAQKARLEGDSKKVIELIRQLIASRTGNEKNDPSTAQKKIKRSSRRKRLLFAGKQSNVNSPTLYHLLRFSSHNNGNRLAI